jgi:hypothetical protein
MSKELLTAMRLQGLTEYGSVISGDFVRETIGVTLPVYGNKRDFDGAALAELAAVSYVRDQLLNEGKYLAGHNGDYRILLPSENKAQVEAYMYQADRKLRRAQKLFANTPASVSVPDNTLARLHMKRSSIRPTTCSLRGEIHA